MSTLKVPVMNTEADMFDIIYKGKKKVFKSLHHNMGPIFANKLYTLEMLNTYKKYISENIIVPDFLVTVDGNIEGFTVPKVEGENLEILLYDDSISRHEQIKALKQIGQILEDMKRIRNYTPLTQFYLGDLHAANFILKSSDNELCVVDLDSCSIMGNKPFISKYLTPGSRLISYDKDKYKLCDDYNFGYIVPDENTDYYCYIMTILNYLTCGHVQSYSMDDYYDFLNKLNDLGYDRGLIEKFELVVTSRNNENPYEYLETITEDQINKTRIKL